jgi:hypothetical protein
MKKIRVVSLPGRNYLGNDYFKLFCEALEGAGLDVINMHESRAKVLRFDVLHMYFTYTFQNISSLSAVFYELSSPWQLL